MVHDDSLVHLSVQKIHQFIIGRFSFSPVGSVCKNLTRVDPWGSLNPPFTSIETKSTRSSGDDAKSGMQT